jgi:hypothetical protein
MGHGGQATAMTRDGYDDLHFFILINLIEKGNSRHDLEPKSNSKRLPKMTWLAKFWKKI